LPVRRRSEKFPVRFSFRRVLYIEIEMTSDCELLRRFAKTNSEDAFAELVKRHVHLVYSAALRQVGGDAHLAQDVAQTVFADLARKAGPLSRRETLTGWLYTSAHFAAAKIVRTENRRRDREDKFMREPTNEPAPAADWEQLRLALDDAMHELNETDREAILFRYFENQPFIQVGAKLGLNENAARMRVERALEKLRAIFAKRGVTTATTLASVISANAVQIAPAGLATTLTTASIATAGTGTLALMKIMTMAKLKLGIGALVVAGAATTLVVQHKAQTKLRDEGESLRQQIAQLQANNESLSNRLAAADAKPSSSQSLPNEQFNELLKLRGEVGVLRRQVDEVGKLREENQRLGSALKQAGSVTGSKPATHPTELELLQQDFQEQEAIIQAAQTNLDLLRKKYNVQDTSPTQLAETNLALASSEEPYWVAKRSLANMIDFHKVLQAKITSLEIDQGIRNQIDQQIKNRNGSN
jgi:RNA polymerase sigma factor (sigma-70 family)